MTIPDPLTALQAHLQADTPLVALLTDAARIYTRELPAAEAPQQPRNAVVIAAAGGGGDDGYMLISRPRVDVKSYGATPFEAARVDLAVLAAMKPLDRRAVTGEALLHNAVVEGGPIPLRDPNLNDAPFVLRVFQVLVSEEAVA